MSKKVTIDIIVDVQKDFITGSLANPQAQANVVDVATIVKQHAAEGHWLFFTKDTHSTDYMDSREGKSLPIPHCIKNTDGWTYAPQLQAVIDEIHPVVMREIEKPTFGSIALPQAINEELSQHQLTNADIDKIIIYGYCTDICVISNAMILRGAFPEIDIEILSDYSAGVTVESHENALNAMRACQFIVR